MRDVCSCCIQNQADWTALAKDAGHLVSIFTLDIRDTTLAIYRLVARDSANSQSLTRVHVCRPLSLSIV